MLVTTNDGGYMRKVAIFSVVALAASTLGMGTASAKTLPPAGTINCSMAGTLTLNHPLSNTAGTKAIKIKGTATGTSCDNSGVTVGTGKEPITAVAVKISGSLPVGATCVSLAAPAFGKTKIQAKFQGLNPKGKLSTVTVDNTFLATASVSVGTTITLSLVSQPLTKSGFVGQTLTLNLGLDQDAATLLGACATGITSLAFGSVTPSSVTSP